MLNAPSLCTALCNSCPCLGNNSLQKSEMSSAFKRHNNETCPFGGLNGPQSLTAACAGNTSLEGRLQEEKLCSQMHITKRSVSYLIPNCTARKSRQNFSIWYRLGGVYSRMCAAILRLCNKASPMTSFGSLKQSAAVFLTAAVPS